MRLSQRFCVNALHSLWPYTPTLVRFLEVRAHLDLSAMSDRPTFWLGASPSSATSLFRTMAVPKNRMWVDWIIKN